MDKYDYLKPFIDNAGPPPRNWFTQIDINRIENAELRLGFEIPAPLKEFWQNIGEGKLQCSKFSEHIFDSGNYLLSPEEVVGVTLWTEDTIAVGEIEDLLQNGTISGRDVVFFEICNSSDFLVLKPDSEYPEGVYGMFGELIEPKFEDFIWKLYHISPTYYFSH